MTCTVHHSDCVAWLLAHDGPLFDACVTDPPYHLTSIVKRFGGDNAAPARKGKGDTATGAYARASRGFMGKQWDGGDVAFRPETWRAVYDRLKPGAHLVAFSGTRTYHRLVCAIEDAGFEIRDQLGQLLLAIARSDQGELAPTLGEEAREPVARLQNALDEDDLRRVDDHLSGEHSRADDGKRKRVPSRGAMRLLLLISIAHEGPRQRGAFVFRLLQAGHRA